VGRKAPRLLCSFAYPREGISSLAEVITGVSGGSSFASSCPYPSQIKQDQT